MPKLNPDVLRWARETANLSLEDAADGIELNDAHGKSGAERLAALEAGEVEPTRQLLLRMADKYRRPLLVFYLKAPPKKAGRGQDFRTLPSTKPLAYDPLLDALMRDIHSRQQIVRSMLEDEETPPLAFVASYTMKQGVAPLVEQITKTLSFGLSDFRKQPRIDEAFRYLRSRMEMAGMFVLLAGNLGSHHSDISPSVFRGFAIADSIAPFVVINDQDSRTAWSFTALHEAAHIWLGHTGVSAGYVDSGVERFCNDVASEILLPSHEIQELEALRFGSSEEAITQISAFADARKVSRAMVAYRLYRSDVISIERWHVLNRQLSQDWQEIKKIKKAEERSGGPNYYVVKRHRLGAALLSVVGRSLAEGTVSYTRAARVLGVKARNVKPLLRDTAFEGGA